MKILIMFCVIFCYFSCSNKTYDNSRVTDSSVMGNEGIENYQNDRYLFIEYVSLGMSLDNFITICSDKFSSEVPSIVRQSGDDEGRVVFYERTEGVDNSVKYVTYKFEEGNCVLISAGIRIPMEIYTDGVESIKELYKMKYNSMTLNQIIKVDLLSNEERPGLIWINEELTILLDWTSTSDIEEDATFGLIQILMISNEYAEKNGLTIQNQAWIKFQSEKDAIR